MKIHRIFSNFVINMITIYTMLFDYRRLFLQLKRGLTQSIKCNDWFGIEKEAII